jgi:predicted RNase H-like nuclease (RuvC/YqgF family)
MTNFIQKQIEVSERLFYAMKKDHEERTNRIEVWQKTSDSLMAKLEERDREIEQLRAKING